MAEELQRTVRTAFRAIALGNIEEILDLCQDDTILTWGPFEFRGKAEIRKWAGELLQLFVSLSFVENSLSISENTATHEFFMETINKDRSKGLLPVTGIYHFEGGKFKDLTINLGYGFIFKDPSEAGRWKEELRRRTPQL